MLAYLTVRNFALVASLELRFVNGLTVITGESGAGKSILLDALALVLGQRASRNQIRPNANECDVTAEFELNQAPTTHELLASQNLQDTNEPNRCVVRRVVTRDGRSRAWVNGAPVSLNVLRQLCGSLIAIHDQFAQQQLLGSMSQLAWFDDFIAEPRLVALVRQKFQDWQAHTAALSEAQQRHETASERRELLQYQIKELDEFELQEHEFEELSVRFKRLNNRQAILATIAQVLESLTEVHAPGVSRARNDIDQLDDQGTELKTAKELVEGAEVGLEEAIHQLRGYFDSLSTEDISLEKISERLDGIHDLARKHRVQSIDLYTKSLKLREELSALDADESQLVSMKAAAHEASEAYHATAQKLSQKRLHATEPFAAQVIARLNEIGMHQAQFAVTLVEGQGEHGLERVNFIVSANSRYEPGPLKAIASGGELSRISLAILTVIANRSNLPCLVLDEADIGVSGTTADEIGRMLRRLASQSQVVCVTHAPQVAALGDAHLKVLKTPKEDIVACALSNGERVEEIARMVAGKEINAESRHYAATLLNDAHQTQHKAIA